MKETIKEFTVAFEELNKQEDKLRAEIAPMIETLVAAKDRHGLHDLIGRLPRGFGGIQFIYAELYKLDHGEDS